MRSKTLKAVISFATTSDAMAFDAAARTGNIPGRLIPVPTEIDAGCGLAWCAEAAEAQLLVSALKDHDLACESMYEVEMY